MTPTQPTATTTEVSEAMVSAARNVIWGKDSSHLSGDELIRAALEAAALSTAPSGDGVPGMVLITGCASDGCGKQATIRFERGGVGSYYCHDCYMRIQAIPASQRGTE